MGVAGSGRRRTEGNQPDGIDGQAADENRGPWCSVARVRRRPKAAASKLQLNVVIARGRATRHAMKSRPWLRRENRHNTPLFSAMLDIAGRGGQWAGLGG